MADVEEVEEMEEEKEVEVDERGQEEIRTSPQRDLGGRWTRHEDRNTEQSPGLRTAESAESGSGAASW